MPFSTELKDYNELFELVAQQGCNFLLERKVSLLNQGRSLSIKVVSRTGQNCIAVELPSKTDKELSFG